ncbi:MAG: hypothetical protein ACLFNT_06160 [Spirochaetales bacterium]
MRLTRRGRFVRRKDRETTITILSDGLASTRLGLPMAPVGSIGSIAGAFGGGT